MIVAVLIVKNESHVLERCLRSVLPYVDKVHISDTGSTDKETRDMIHITDQLTEETNKTIMFMPRPWEGFAASRNQALEDATRLLRCTPNDWLFMIDADDYVTAWDEPPEDTTHVGFRVTMQGGSIVYPRTQLFRPGLWRYRGVVHEFPEQTEPRFFKNVGTLQTTVVSTREGDRNRDPEKYRKDADLLQEALIENTDPDLAPRYQFYLAQSLRDAGEHGDASKWYMVRAQNSEGYQEERYVSILNNMRLKHTYDGWDDGGYDLKAQMELAQSICPHRKECVVQMMKWLTEFKAWNEVIHLYEHYKATLDVPTGLFVEPSAYGYHMHDLAGVAYYYADRHPSSLRASLTALSMLPNLSVDTKRLIENIEFALAKLP